jgi:YidC/Oxa1 family membrane protein insertase
MDNQRNLFLAIAISVAIMIGFQYFFGKSLGSHQDTAVSQNKSQPRNDSLAPPAGDVQAVPRAPVASAPITGSTLSAAADTGPRIKIVTPRLTGSIALKGARFDELSLTDYHETIDPNSPAITLFSPLSKQDPYFAESGWLAQDANVPVPTADTVWKADSDTLTPQKPVHLTWDNGHGSVFTRTLTVDDNFLFTITDKVDNRSAQPVTLYPYGLVNRTGTPTLPATYLVHEGLLGVLGDTKQELTFKSERGEQKPVTSTYNSKGGWVGITDQYWLAAFAWGGDQDVTANMNHHLEGTLDKYQADYRGTAMVVPAGGSAETTAHLFAGAKDVKLLAAYSDNPGIERLDLAIDWGWFPFITKPIFYALDYLNNLFGNFGLAILALTVCVKALFFPLANKSYRSMSAMRNLQPQMTALRERYKDDKAKLNQAVMELYRKEKVNPAAGCLPIVIQIPVFYSLYSVLYITIEMRHAPFFGWIHDLSARDPTTVFNLFGLIPWDPSHFHIGPLSFALPAIGAWALIMGMTMFFQMRLNPQPADPIQAKLFMFMPLIFTFILAPFPAGLVIYWAWNNSLSIAQQWIIMRRSGHKKPATVRR